MKITILTENLKGWIIPYIEKLIVELSYFHEIDHVYKISDISKGDILFLLSCEKIIPAKYLLFYKNNIVIHPSNLPKGKGHSPLAWQILEGKKKIQISLFEADEAVDSGKIYLTDYIELKGHELNDEIKHLQGLTTIRIIKRYLIKYNSLKGKSQSGSETFYQKRGSNDSELSLDKTIEKQFNLLRVVDNDRYPAFFIRKGQKYILKIYKDKK